MLSKKLTEISRVTFPSSILIIATMFILPGAQAQAPIPPSIATPDKVDTRVGTLDFKDGAPSAETVTKIYFGPKQPAGVKRQLDTDHAR
jgi:hypothetical protein